MISPSSSSPLLTKSTTALSNILGWDHAQVGSKALDFASELNALGISIQLKQLHSGSFILANKEGRIQRICSTQEGTISSSKASEVQGHLNFATGFFLSKGLQFLVSAFSKLADLPRSMFASDLQLLCELSINLLSTMAPRHYKAGSFDKPLLIFTDGAWESGRASAGAFIHDSSTGYSTTFAVDFLEKLVSLWLEDVGDQVISQVEMFAFLCVRFKYHARLSNRVAVAWIDNQAAKYACIKGTSQSFSLQVMCRVLQQLEVEDPSAIWYDRVASFSNPSDLASRGREHDAAKMFNALLEPIWTPPKILLEQSLISTSSR